MSPVPAKAQAAGAASAGAASGVPAIQPPFDTLVAQPLVARFLSSAVSEGRLSHAYLFVGPIGSGKTEAALALARAALCPRGGHDNCEDCVRVLRKTHPDLHVIEPDGVEGYLTAQIRELIHDATLAPVRARVKVYLITRADLMTGAAADAFLKTLEEPPASTLFILLARTALNVRATLRSRCQVIAFSFIPEVEATQMLMASVSATEKEARMALAAVGGSTMRAREFLQSEARRGARVQVLSIVERMLDADALDVLEAARELTIVFKAPLDELRAEQSEQLEKSREFLGKGSQTSLEKRFTRQLSAREREQIAEGFDVIRSWLRDCLLVRVGRSGDVVNTDFHMNISRAAAVATEEGLINALDAVDKASEWMHYNVSVQSAFESLLFAIREVLEEND